MNPGPPEFETPGNLACFATLLPTLSFVRVLVLVLVLAASYRTSKADGNVHVASAQPHAVGPSDKATLQIDCWSRVQPNALNATVAVQLVL